MDLELLTSFVGNLSTLGRVRRENVDGRQYLVANVVLVVPGVLAGSKGPLLYPANIVQGMTTSWDFVPVTVNHPRNRDGVPISARDPGAAGTIIGFLRRPNYTDRLRAEAWIDVLVAKRVDARIVANLERGNAVEVSTGLFTDHVAQFGEFRGRRFDYVVRGGKPDHLAILPDHVGACSLSDGCGLNVNRDSHSLGGSYMNQQFDPHADLLVPPTLNVEGALDHKAKCQCRKCLGDGQPTDNRKAAADDTDVLVPPSLFDR